ncbi:hypothetical protein RRG08_021793 [Elysia crispata]|uniref:Uncharacterized protein n=1 Tax=Elysia crispata TaxID=231223 RepID=A0AAE0ZYM4_9GAST|nr:hypothetical protein RRG08_021793 [Elysia crispata]
MNLLSRTKEAEIQICLARLSPIDGGHPCGTFDLWQVPELLSHGTHVRGREPHRARRVPRFSPWVETYTRGALALSNYLLLLKGFLFVTQGAKISSKDSFIQNLVMVELH